MITPETTSTERREAVLPSSALPERPLEILRQSSELVNQKLVSTTDAIR